MAKSDRTKKWFVIGRYVGWGGPHLGLMHLVATNVVAWIRHVLQVGVGYLGYLGYLGYRGYLEYLGYLTHPGVDARVPRGDEGGGGGGGGRP